MNNVVRTTSAASQSAIAPARPRESAGGEVIAGPGTGGTWRSLRPRGGGGDTGA